jgi:uncharacterized RDD family membrane protein YckC
MPHSIEQKASRPERVLHVRAAGFSRRLLAAVIDLLLIVGVASGVTVLAAFALGVPLPSRKELGPDFMVAGLLDRNPMAIGAAGLFAGLGALYHLYLGGMVGQTVGKRLLRIRVIGSRGGPPGPAGAVGRLAALVLSTLPVGLGWLWCLFDRERRAFHDHLAGTYVIRDDP